MWASPGLPDFDYVRASTAAEVIRLRQEHGESARLLMGGTDLLVRMRDGAVHPQVVVDVKHLPGMREVVYERGTGLTLGAAVTMNQVARHSATRRQCPLLAEAASTVASYQVRNRATLGGNLCNASPAADTAPAVLVLEGRVMLQGPAGLREVPAGEFFVGPGQTSMAPDEFLVAVRLPKPAGGAGRYLKLGRNRAGDLAIAGVAAWGFPDPTASSGYRFRIGLASVAPVPLRARAAEEVLADGLPGEETFALAAEKAMEAASPISDVRASAGYRKGMVRILTLRALREVWARLQAGV